MKPSSPLVILIFSVLLFTLLEIIGTSMSMIKPLWRDELNTQSYTIHESYTDILKGRNPMEGNRAPLFYLTQKLFCDALGFKTPQAWLKGHWDEIDPAANLSLRILPVIWMSLFFVLIFSYFSIRFNVLVGIFGFLTALSYPLLWLYWSEARPYSLWVLLTGIQMVLFLDILMMNNRNRATWFGLSLTHCLLALTCALSVFQILIVSLILLTKERQSLKYILGLFLPAVILFCYWPLGTGDNVIFITTVPPIFFSTVQINQIAVLALYLILLRIQALVCFNDQLGRALPFFLGIFMMLISTYTFLIHLHAHASGHGQFVIQRHILFLVPVVVIALTYLLGLIAQSLKSQILKIILITGMIAILLLPVPEFTIKIHYMLSHSPYV